MKWNNSFFGTISKFFPDEIRLVFKKNWLGYSQLSLREIEYTRDGRYNIFYIKNWETKTSKNDLGKRKEPM